MNNYTKDDIIENGETLSFDEIKLYLSKVNEDYGIFDLHILNCGKEYFFKHLKETYTLNDNNFGFSKSHGVSEQWCKRSQFHDEEDVYVTIDRSVFISSHVWKTFMVIKTKTFTIFVDWT